MFANVTIYSGGNHPSVGVPKQALIYEGDHVRLWVVHDDKSIELREIETGLTNGDSVEVRTNLKAGENAGPCSGWPPGSSKRKGGGPNASASGWVTSWVR